MSKQARPLTSAKPKTIKSAYLSDDGVYRYLLSRKWGPGKALLWVMLNPSTADDQVDDQTMRSVVGITAHNGYGEAIVANLYALRSTDPKVLRDHSDPIGPENDQVLQACANRARRPDLGVRLDVAVAWGTNGGQRAIDVLWGFLVGVPLYCVGQTKEGHPKHPCRLSHATDLVPFRIPLSYAK